MEEEKTEVVEETTEEQPEVIDHPKFIPPVGNPGMNPGLESAINRALSPDYTPLFDSYKQIIEALDHNATVMQNTVTEMQKKISKMNKEIAGLFAGFIIVLLAVIFK